mgnify:CR=1 FL=1|jgi:hypothetical protein
MLNIERGLKNMCRINRLLSLTLSVAVMLILLLLITEATVAHAQRPCTDSEIWAVFPTSRDLGDVNDQLLTKNGPTLNKDGTRTFSMRWQGAATSRSVSVTLTEYLEPKEASKKVHGYGFDNTKGQTKSGMVKLGFGDEGFRTDDRKRPYYLVHKGQFALSYYTSYPGRSGGAPGNQDPTVEKIINRIAALPCLGLTVQPPPPPPTNNCPKVTLTASPPKATPSQTITLVARATDPEGDPLTMKWSVTDSKGNRLKVPWNGRVATGNAQMTNTVSWKNPPIGQYKITVAVSDGNCGKTEKVSTQVLIQAGMAVSVATKLKTYSPGEKVLIHGSVRDEKGGLDLVKVEINVEGTLLSTNTDPFGKYTRVFPIPPSSKPMNYKVIAKASCSKYPPKSASTSFSVGKKALLVKIRTDKTHYLIGETVECTITVTDSQGIAASNTDLTITATRLKSGKKPVVSCGKQDPPGKYSCTIPWGKKTTGKPIAEGKLKIEVKAEHLGASTHLGYDPGYHSILVSGCGDGDLECSDPNTYCENCFNCPEDSQCKAEEICDPLNKLSDPKTGCSPKMAIIFTTNDDPAYTWWHQLQTQDELKFIREKFKGYKYHVKTVPLSGKLTYLPKIKENQWVPDKTQIAKYLARPSTKAIAFFGHGGAMIDESKVPLISNYLSKYIPSLGGENTAEKLWRSVFNATRSNYQKLYNITHQEAGKMTAQKMQASGWNCGLDYAYIHACHSLDNNTMLDFLIRDGGTYWGDVGVLWGIRPLVKKTKP